MVASPGNQHPPPPLGAFQKSPHSLKLGCGWKGLVTNNKKCYKVVVSELRTKAKYYNKRHPFGSYPLEITRDLGDEEPGTNTPNVLKFHPCCRCQNFLFFFFNFNFFFVFEKERERESGDEGQREDRETLKPSAEPHRADIGLNLTAVRS